MGKRRVCPVCKRRVAVNNSNRFTQHRYIGGGHAVLCTGGGMIPAERSTHKQHKRSANASISFAHWNAIPVLDTAEQTREYLASVGLAKGNDVTPADAGVTSKLGSNTTQSTVQEATP